MGVPSYRRKCLRAKGEECVACGATEAIEVHHLNGDRTNNELDNLIPLCRLCHTRVHKGGLDGLEEHLLPVEERPQIDKTKVTYQIQVRTSFWNEWKETVPRSKSLESRITELIEADLERAEQEDGNEG